MNNTSDTFPVITVSMNPECWVNITATSLMVEDAADMHSDEETLVEDLEYCYILTSVIEDVNMTAFVLKKLEPGECLRYSLYDDEPSLIDADRVGKHISALSGMNEDGELLPGYNVYNRKVGEYDVTAVFIDDARDPDYCFITRR